MRLGEPSVRPTRWIGGKPGYRRAGVLFIVGAVIMAVGIGEALQDVGPERFFLPALAAALWVASFTDISTMRRQRKREETEQP